MAKEMATSSDAEVSNCVSGLIRAFTDSLNVFKKLRETRRKRKEKRQSKDSQNEVVSRAETQLSKSLRRGPKDIEQTYNLGYSQVGNRFAKGDAIAHASLAETLIRLNTGLVSIINTFLHHDPKSSPLHLDYKSLTSLSDASRAEAVSSLNLLCQRMSQSHINLHVQRIGVCPKCGSGKHFNCSGAVRGDEVVAKPKSNVKRRSSTSRSRPSGPTVMKWQVKGSGQPQLVVLRPKPSSKKGTSSSSSSTKSQAITAMSSPEASPLGSPLPLYSAQDPFPPQKPSHAKANPPNQGRRRASSIDGPRPTTWPFTKPEINVPVQPMPPSMPPPPVPKMPSQSPKKTKTSALKEKEKEKCVPLSAIPSPVRRRIDKVTPSTYTFASDSTKLGEIPERNWTIPWNYEEAERLNAQAALIAHAPPPPEEAKLKKKKRFKFLRRESRA
ncbi:hypothetical protein BU24DRAFT_170444 [Aaosphaeria arxii CBS 175.79]|uniref:Uncharacterized protein n=1 Tax=Aaosphaeria arxii CBS 175.79 TaxID=1450172 RepID=A0A6A5Y0T7_9PLEO|nr:uncharacterized protein BU24DRAFT_170444 [Aaosphaeria arxii CBS 175.79]KAF2018410.1 hypothetical protein BU24DRAFT_170444 [Aaosphaeria arxii CBS 175.79]